MRSFACVSQSTALSVALSLALLSGCDDGGAQVAREGIPQARRRPTSAPAAGSHSLLSRQFSARGNTPPGLLPPAPVGLRRADGSQALPVSHDEEIVSGPALETPYSTASEPRPLVDTAGLTPSEHEAVVLRDAERISSQAIEPGFISGEARRSAGLGALAAPRRAAPEATSIDEFEVRDSFEALNEPLEVGEPIIAAEEESQLPWNAERVQTPEMLAVVRQAEELSRRASLLSARGAHHSARADFTTALRLIAAALDAHHATRTHVRALEAGLRAIDEAEDLRRARTATGNRSDLRSIIQRHRTPVLHDLPEEALEPLAARQAYYTYAGEQLAAATGREPAGSLALYGLGRLQSSLTAPTELPIESWLPRAMTFYQAALLVDDQNFLASNELAVAYVECGHAREARGLLTAAAARTSQPEVWHNLAALHRQLGEKELAQRAAQRASAEEHRLRAQAGPLAATGLPIRIVDRQHFAQAAPPFDAIPSAKSSAPHAAPSAPAAKSETRWPWAMRK